jgi:hypothetical protein
MYDIKEYSYKKAKQLNVIIKPSKHKNKKIDVYDKNNNFICSIGDINFFDFPTYLTIDKDLAKQRRKLYKIRREKNRHIKNTKGFHADQILW